MLFLPARIRITHETPTKQWLTTKGRRFLSLLLSDNIKHKRAIIEMKSAAILHDPIHNQAICFSFVSNNISASHNGVHLLLRLSLTYK